MGVARKGRRRILSSEESGGTESQESSSGKSGKRKGRVALRSNREEIHRIDTVYLDRSLKFHELKRDFLCKILLRFAIRNRLKEFISSPNPRPNGTDEENEAADERRIADSHTHAEGFSEWDPSDEEPEK